MADTEPATAAKLRRWWRGFGWDNVVLLMALLAVTAVVVYMAVGDV